MGHQGLPPGFRFSPTDEELVVYYLKNKVCGRSVHQGIIAEVDIYKFEPWDLPEKSALPSSRDREWYFFNAQDRKHSHMARINRKTCQGYWKATGKDRKVCCGPGTVGWKKTLIYYEGRAPRGKRTDWTMHEYRLDEESEKKINIVCSAVLCRVRKKGGPGPRNGDQYGALVSYEDDETQMPLNSGLVDDADEKLLELSESRVPDQHEVSKLPGQMDLSEMLVEGHRTDDLLRMEGFLGAECDPDWDTFLRIFMFDTVQEASLESGRASISNQEGGTIPQFVEMQNGDALSDLEGLPVLSSLLELDGNSLHDILHPAPGEAEILGEMMLHLGTGQGDVSSIEGSERMMSQALAYNHGPFNDDGCLMGGDFIELDDMNSPLDGFVMRSPVQRRHDEQQLTISISNNGIETHGWASDVLYTQGSAARRARLQIPASVGNIINADLPQQLEAVRGVFPEVQLHTCGVSNDIGIQIAGNTLNNKCGSFAESSPGSGFYPSHSAHIIESSTRSFLSKHMSSYTVSKCEEAPPQLHYAELTDSQDADPRIANDSAIYSTALVIKDGSMVETAAFEKDSPIPGASSIASSRSSGPPTTTSSTQEARPVSEATRVPSVFGCNRVELEIEHPHTTSPCRYFWNTSLKGLVTQAKSSSLGAQLMQLEGCLQTRFNDKVFALGKLAAGFFSDNNPYNSLRRGVMVSLLRLAMAVLVFFCLFLGFCTLTKYAFDILV